MICIRREKEEIIWLLLEKDQFYASLDIFKIQISPFCVALHRSTANKHYQREIFAISKFPLDLIQLLQPH